MSERSELIEAERRQMAKARAAYEANPNMSSFKLYRIIRPKPEDN